jgi:hypothetical protein
MSITLPTKTHIKKPAKGTVAYASTFATDLGEYSINVGRKGTDGVRTDMLYPAIRQMEAMLSYHNKVYQIRLESHSPKYEADNKEFVAMLARLKAWLHGKGHKRVAYLWVREKETSKAYHYHLVLWLDGNLIRTPDSIYRRWDELHIERAHSHTYWVKSTPMVHRGAPETHSKAVYVFSYLCKERGKGYGDRYSRDFSTSLIKRNVKKIPQ